MSLCGSAASYLYWCCEEGLRYIVRDLDTRIAECKTKEEFKGLIDYIDQCVKDRSWYEMRPGQS